MSVCSNKNIKEHTITLKYTYLFISVFVIYNFLTALFFWLHSICIDLFTWTAPNHLREIKLRMLLFHNDILKTSLFTLSHEVSLSFKSFLMTSFNPFGDNLLFVWSQMDGQKEHFGDLLFFFCKMCPIHHDSFVVTLKSGISQTDS